MTNEIVTIQPGELTFLFESNKQSSCSLQLVNNMDFHVAFKVETTSPKKYFVRPDTGVIPPQFTCDVTVTMQAQKEIPPDMQCKDKFLMQSVKVPARMTAKDITLDMFNKKSDNGYEEHKLRVVYVSPVQTTSPEPQPLKDGSAPKESVDNRRQRVSSADNVVLKVLRKLKGKLSEVIDAEDLKYAPLLNAVVKVYCIHTEPDYILPWQKKRSQTSSSSAFMIGGRKLVTNAHCVEYHTQVKVKRRGDETTYVATVLAKGVDCDIALLSVESEGFWKGTKPLQFGSRLPCLKDAVTVVGYPVGGETISVIKGVVSRIEVTSYGPGCADLLGIQTDAAINCGNSGGPAFDDSGWCIGIAFKVFRSANAQNIGYLIPATVVWHFLNDYQRNGKYTGFPSLGVSLQKLENPALRARLNVTVNQGVLIQSVEQTSPAKGDLKKGDIIVSIDRKRVANDGTVRFHSTERVGLEYLISRKYTGDTAELGIIREGKKMNVETTLKPHVHLVPYQIEGGQPSYLIVGGLVFTPLSESLIDNLCEESMRVRCSPVLRGSGSESGEWERKQERERHFQKLPLKLIAKAKYSLPKFEREQMVMLSQVLANDINIGYEDISNQQVLKLNETKIKNIRQLARIVDSCDAKYLDFELEDNFRVVIERQAALAANPKILKDHGIACERSSDLL